jgi:hypothetical protein
MWPITTLANYRLALRAPAEFAVQSLDEANTNFLFGPLSEVIAQHHSWDDLKGHLSDVHIADVVAHECGIRGADISYTPTLQVFDIPHTLQRISISHLSIRTPACNMTHPNSTANCNRLKLQRKQMWSKIGIRPVRFVP